ncbi:MAG: glycine--tRNA ligase subunit beta [Chloroflexi bacterium]|nr:glycine--tRNA ligase subunit beta [Chloroflexota bacterium]
MSSKSLSFQDVIMRLQSYWAEQGCLIWQPYSEKVGAGTGNPATVLRVLGPEPWNVAYVEPSYRPDDGRYAENPNRMQMHTQFQVILKPAPADSQELYLRSLEAIGIDRNQHDIRFVEDNWESPALGAWGLGWEVWLDGMEITQFTYFQQAGGYPLDPIPVEYTYGLERIIMYLQGVKEVWQINWDGRRTYGDVLKLAEIEHCKYDFEVADVGRLKQMYDIFEAEAKNALAHRLVIPAHDYVLRCSHTFNLLDARGAIGVTERAAFFARMRDLARQVSVAYVEQRQHEEYPWLEETSSQVAKGEGASHLVTVSPDHLVTLSPSHPVTYLLEIGAEELPPGDLVDAIAQLTAAVPKLLTDLRLAHGEVFVSGTPRRLVVLVKALAPQQAEEETVVKGPPAERAFDASGAATPAAVGFARKYGLPVEALDVRQEGAGRYVFAVVQRAGRPTTEALAEALPGLIAGIKFGKTMRWNATNVAFSRPVRWLVSLLGETVVPFAYAGLTADRMTRGPRAEGSPELEVTSADAYLPLMALHNIIVDRTARRAAVAAQVVELAAEVGGTTPDDPCLLDEVTDLVEQPTAIRGSFDIGYLRLPKEVLITVMKKHQRYFPVVSKLVRGKLVDWESDAQVTNLPTYQSTRLLPFFITVRNGGAEHARVVQAGNEGVIRARYADANYFFKADTSRKLVEFTPRLATLTFQEKLGSMLDKVHRLEKLAPAVGRQLSMDDAELATTARAAALAKSDLATQMVVELTSLQGIMGREYARLSGESDAVAVAIFEHYLPRSQGDALPQTRPGLALGIASRLDSLVGLFAVGLAPTASADPFGLRRDALGLVQTLVGAGQAFDLRPALAAAAALMPVPAGEQVLADVLAFIRDRLYGWLRDQGLPHDAVNAALAERAFDLSAATATARDLAELVKSSDWPEVFTAYARCKRIVRNLTETYPLAPEHYTEPATSALYDAYQHATRNTQHATRTIAALAEQLRVLQAPINRFFANVLVNAEDPAVRRARLALVQRIAALPEGIADLSQLQGF